MLKGRVLLLNAGGAVLGTIGVARSMRMTLREDNPVTILAEMPNTFLHDGRGNSYPVPSILMLKNFINVAKNRDESGGKRAKIYMRDGYQCQYCGIKASAKPKSNQIHVKDLTWDHITPKSKGGSSLASNLVTACQPCNRKKADRNPEQARMPLRTKIHDITKIGADNLMLCKYVEHRPEWLFYLEAKEGFKETYEKYKEMVA